MPLSFITLQAAMLLVLVAHSHRKKKGFGIGCSELFCLLHPF